MRVSVAGTGYVGLVSGVCLADKGRQVVCVDTDAEKVKMINAGKSPIYENGLDDLLRQHIGQNVRATQDLRAAVLDSELSLIAVGTPFDGNEIDVSYIKQVSKEIGLALKDKDEYHVVVVKSTVVPGTSDEIVLPIIEEYSGKKAGKDFGVGMNPEFLREGEAISDFRNPDRIVLGGMDERTIDVLDELYRPFSGVDKIRTNNKTAETIKYTSNSLLATLISFSNEIGNMCARINGVDAIEVMHGVHLDKRFSPLLDDIGRVTPGSISYLEAGCGFGGSCFPKDVKALIAFGENRGNSMQLLRTVIDINNAQPMHMLKMLNKHYNDFSGMKIAILGLAFKPETDDMRESPAIPIVHELSKQNVSIRAYDPVAENEARHVFADTDIRYCSSVDEAIEGVDAIMLLTRWSVFSNLAENINRVNPNALLIDGRRMVEKRSVARYEGIGV